MQELFTTDEAEIVIKWIEGEYDVFTSKGDYVVYRLPRNLEFKLYSRYDAVSMLSMPCKVDMGEWIYEHLAEIHQKFGRDGILNELSPLATTSVIETSGIAVEVF